MQTITLSREIDLSRFILVCVMPESICSGNSKVRQILNRFKIKVAYQFSMWSPPAIGSAGKYVAVAKLLFLAKICFNYECVCRDCVCFFTAGGFPRGEIINQGLGSMRLKLRSISSFTQYNRQAAKVESILLTGDEIQYHYRAIFPKGGACSHPTTQLSFVRVKRCGQQLQRYKTGYKAESLNFSTAQCARSHPPGY